MRRLLRQCFRNRASTTRRGRVHTFFTSKRIPRRLTTCTPLFTCFSRRVRHSTRTRINRPSSKPRSMSIPFHSTGQGHTTLCLFSNITTYILTLLDLAHLLCPTSPYFYSSDCIIVGNHYCASVRGIHSLTVRTLRRITAPTSSCFPRVSGSRTSHQVVSGRLGRLNDLFDRSRWGGVGVGRLECELLVVLTTLVLLPANIKTTRTRGSLGVRSIFAHCNGGEGIAVIRLSGRVLRACNVAHCGDVAVGSSPRTLHFAHRYLRTSRQKTHGVGRIASSKKIISTCCRLPNGSPSIGHFILFGIGSGKAVALICVRKRLSDSSLVALLFAGGSLWASGRRGV